MKHLITVIAIITASVAFSQNTSRPLTKRLIVKTNLLSLVAQRPTITVEKIFTKSFSAEFSFVQGQFNNFFLTDHYDYHGFLVRAKKHFIPLEAGSLSPYVGIYAGNLKRNIQTTGQTIGPFGVFSYSSRDFSASSIRGGGSFGMSYISKSRIVVDVLASLGYGTYTKVYKPDIPRNKKGYLDAQVWFSVGYCF